MTKQDLLDRLDDIKWDLFDYEDSVSSGFESPNAICEELNRLNLAIADIQADCDNYLKVKEDDKI